MDTGDGQLLLEAIPVILKKLRTLIRTIEEAPSYRLYGSSLLLLYEGMPEEVTTAPLSQRSDESVSETSSDSDTYAADVDDGDAGDDGASDGEGIQISKVVATSSSSVVSLPRAIPSRAPTPRRRTLRKCSSRDGGSRKLDMRMIDFTHCTTKQREIDDAVHGPDQGYLFGLRNLVKVFEEIRDNDRTVFEPIHPAL